MFIGILHTQIVMQQGVTTHVYMHACMESIHDSIICMLWTELGEVGLVWSVSDDCEVYIYYYLCGGVLVS